MALAAAGGSHPPGGGRAAGRALAAKGARAESC